MRKQLITGMLLGLFTLGLTGCMDLESEILVRKDGSGQVIQTAGVPDMGAMFGMPSNAETMKAQIQQMLQQANQQAKLIADSIPGGKVVSVEAIDGPPAKIKTVIGFDDVNAIDLTAVMSALGGQGAPETDENAPKKLAMRLEGGVLTITNNTNQDLDPEAMKEMLTDEQKKQIAMALPMLGDSSLRVAIRAEGGIAETNARHLNAANDRLILIALPLKPFAQALVDKSADIQKALEIKDENDRAKALEALVEGLKIEANNEITVKFK